MISMPLWIASFAYLAFIAAFICTAVKEDDDAHLLKKSLAFFGMIVAGTAVFAGIILAVETLT